MVEIVANIKKKKTSLLFSLSGSSVWAFSKISLEF
jgi:hypothetical protein